MTGKVKYMGKAPSPTPKAVKYAQIDDQGRIPMGVQRPYQFLRRW